MATRWAEAAPTAATVGWAATSSERINVSVPHTASKLREAQRLQGRIAQVQQDAIRELTYGDAQGLKLGRDLAKEAEGMAARAKTLQAEYDALNIPVKEARAIELAQTTKTLADAKAARLDQLASAQQRLDGIHNLFNQKFASERDALTAQAVTAQDGAQALIDKYNAEFQMLSILGHLKGIQGLSTEATAKAYVNTFTSGAIAARDGAIGNLDLAEKAAHAKYLALNDQISQTVAAGPVIGGGNPKKVAASMTEADFTTAAGRAANPNAVDLTFVRNMITLSNSKAVELGLISVQPGAEPAWLLVNPEHHRYFTRTIGSTIGDDEKILKAFKPFVKIWRAQILANPGFSVRNAFGAFFTNYSDGIALRDYHLGSDLIGLLDDAGTNLGTTRAQLLGAIHRKTGLSPLEVADFLGQGGKQLGRGVEIDSAFEGNRLLSNLSKAQGYIDTKLNPVNAVLGGRGHGTEEFMRLSQYLGLRRQGVMHQVATERVLFTQADYSDLSKMDVFAKQVFPFWVWRKQNMLAQATLLGSSNKIGALHVLKATESQRKAIEEGQSIPPFIGSSGFAMKDGGIFNLPFMGGADFVDQIKQPLGSLIHGDVSGAIKQTIRPEQMTPGLRIAQEMLSGHQAFDGRAINDVRPLGPLPGGQASYIASQFPLLTQVARLTTGDNSTSIDNPWLRLLDSLGISQVKRYGDK